MKIECPSCKYIYKIDESKIPDRGAYALCKKCNKRFFIQKQKELTSNISEPQKAENDNILKSIKQCPKCGFQYDIMSEECPKCGVIYKKAISNTKKIEDSSINNTTVSNSKKLDCDTNEDKKNITSKYSSVIYFFRWIFGCYFLLAGLIVMLNYVHIFGIIFLVLSIVLIPSIYHLIRPNPYFKIGRAAKIFSLIIGIICILLGLGAFVVSKIFAGIICVLFGALLFPDVYQFLTDKETKLVQIAGIVILIIIGSWIASQFMLKDMESNKSDSKTHFDSTQKNTNRKKKGNSARWYENGSLHNSSISEWNDATYENKLATASDWAIIRPQIKAKVEKSGSMDTLKPFAVELVKCIDEAAGKDYNSMSSAELAASCMILMEW